MIHSPFLQRIKEDDTGSAIIEFALLVPTILLLLVGVIQVGMIMQSYNAVRNVSADVARYAMVQKQAYNAISNSQIRSFALSHGQGAPYLLKSTSMSVTVNDATLQRIDGAKELTIVIAYQAESLLEFAGIDGPWITYTRPIFLSTT